MSTLKGSKTHENLKHAFAGESQANRRYLYFARAADIEGYPEVGGLFRDTSEAETGHAFGHMDFLKTVGDPATDVGVALDVGSACEVEVAPVRLRLTGERVLQVLVGLRALERFCHVRSSP